MKIGYARVSTTEQSLDLQIDALKGAGCEKLYEEHGVSGTARKRPTLDQCLSDLQAGDVFVVWKFDRAFRSLKHALDTLEELEGRKVDFCELTHRIDTTTPMGKALFHIRGAFAELESGLNSDRTKAGMAAARRRGKHVGRPPALSTEQLSHARKMIDTGEETLGGMASIYDVDRGTLRRALKKESILLHLSSKV